MKAASIAEKQNPRWIKCSTDPNFQKVIELHLHAKSMSIFNFEYNIYFIENKGVVTFYFGWILKRYGLINADLHILTYVVRVNRNTQTTYRSRVYFNYDTCTRLFFSLFHWQMIWPKMCLIDTIWDIGVCPVLNLPSDIKGERGENVSLYTVSIYTQETNWISSFLL